MPDLFWRSLEPTGASGPDYTNPEALKEIRGAYDLNNRKPRAEVISAMVNVIHHQKDNNVYVSEHLSSGAFDIITDYINHQDMKKLILIARRQGAKATYEPKPRRVHIQF